MKVSFQKVVMNSKQHNACKVFNSVAAHRRCLLKLAIVKTGPVVSQKLGLRHVTSSFQEPALLCRQFSQ